MIDFSDKGRTYIGHEEESLEKLAIGRYMFALNYIKDEDICLDAASGSGYGTSLIGKKAKRVIGIEYDREAVKYSIEKYQNNNTDFIQGNLTSKIDLPSNYFDVIVSIETLEHIKQHDVMLSEFKRVLKKNGLLILSTVDHYVYSELGGIRNRHHIGELNKRDLLRLLARYFDLVEIYGQIKYKEPTLNDNIQSIWISILKIIGKIDILKLRYKALSIFGVHSVLNSINNSFSKMDMTEIEKTDFKPDRNYYQLIVVCRKV